MAKVSKTGGVGTAAGHAHRFCVGRGADVSCQIVRRDGVSPRLDAGEHIAAVGRCGRRGRRAGRVGQHHGHPSDAGLVRIMRPIAVQVLKDRSRHLAGREIPEIRGGGGTAHHRDRHLVGGRAAESGRIGLHNRIGADPDPVKHIRSVGCRGRRPQSFAIGPDLHGHAAESGIALTPLAVAVQVVKDCTGDRPLHEVPEIRGGRADRAGDADGLRIGRAAGVSVRIGLLNHIVTGYDTIKRVGTVH